MEGTYEGKEYKKEVGHKERKGKEMWMGKKRRVALKWEKAKRKKRRWEGGEKMKTRTGKKKVKKKRRNIQYNGLCLNPFLLLAHSKELTWHTGSPSAGVWRGGATEPGTAGGRGSSMDLELAVPGVELGSRSGSSGARRKAWQTLTREWHVSRAMPCAPGTPVQRWARDSG